MLRALHEAAIDGNISIKLTQLGLDFDRELCLSLAQEIAAAAASLDNGIEIDMEGSAYTEATLEIFEEVQREHGNTGIALQAYLLRSQADLQRLTTLKSPLEPRLHPQLRPQLRATIRLVKGAYREPPSVAFQKKADVDANYRRLLDSLLRPNKDGPIVAIGTHDPALVDYACNRIRQLGLTPDQYEFQMLLGIRRDLQEKVFSQGHPLRIYVPFGHAWVPYFMRRLSERPANLGFVLRSLLAEDKKGGPI
jgi:proline dehydrogenase